MPKQLLYHRYKMFGHILFWLASIAFMLFFFFFNEGYVHFDFITLTKAIIPNIGFALGVYVHLYVLIPRFLQEKNYIFYIFWLILLLSASSVLIQLLLIFPLRKPLQLENTFRSFDTNLHSAYFFATLIYIAITSLLKFVREWFSLQDLNYKLAKIEQQKLEAELKALKGQLNPHFLFNSLNNIYSLALVQSEKVPELILRLSDLMRHIIYESKENFIPLEKELGFVNNFIALQRIRVNEQVRITYEITGEIPSARIAPLLFEPFIDNAFKHGMPHSGEPDFIQIRFDLTTPGALHFQVKNNYSEMYLQGKKPGIGISNVKQRLNYLYTSSNYQLSVEKEKGIFDVQLRLKLM